MAGQAHPIEHPSATPEIHHQPLKLDPTLLDLPRGLLLIGRPEETIGQLGGEPAVKLEEPVGRILIAFPPRPPTQDDPEQARRVRAPRLPAVSPSKPSGAGNLAASASRNHWRAGSARMNAV
jgi:hypothetical protein